ncbi:MAG: DAK2 domain-containing protein [Candidatus Dormibacteraeota bacterium]|nr:DAK2 domain-containing protein [Candidatus Dormibacteraeota bacterium]
MGATDPAPTGLSVLRPPLREADGGQVMAGLRNALAWLEANQQEINDLNVFPVPDGDTGSNMYLTLRSAVEEAQHAPVPEAVDSVMAAAAHGSLMGARGNSGVILSQILRGLAQGVTGWRTIDASGIARALAEAQAVAYRAVMKPTEGTILTVVREAATAAADAVEEETEDIRLLLERVVREAHASVERTMDQLAVLREAGVVDAGGFGLAVILEGFSRSISESEERISPPSGRLRRGEPPLRRPNEGDPQAAVTLQGRRGAAAVAPREEGWGYCTEFMLTGKNLDVDAIRTELAPLGESALVVGDEDLVRVHIHTEDPAALIAAAAQRGQLSRLKVEDMSAQHHEVLERAAAEEAGDVDVKAETKPLGVVSVAPGGGFRDILKSLGSDAVVLGGQTMNPSIEDLLNAVRAANADAVIMLPNNGNVILTAQQVDDLAEGCDVRVIPSRNLPQGISALLAYDASASVDANCERMQEAMQSVHGVEITRAVRDSSASGHTIKEGDVIAIVDGDIKHVGGDYPAVIQDVLTSQEQAPELVTVYYGDGVGEDEANGLADELRKSHPSTEFEVHEGGQEHYPYVLSLE